MSFGSTSRPRSCDRFVYHARTPPATAARRGRRNTFFRVFFVASSASLATREHHAFRPNCRPVPRYYATRAHSVCAARVDLHAAILRSGVGRVRPKVWPDRFARTASLSILGCLLVLLGSDEGKALLARKCATSPRSGRCCYIAAFVVAMVVDGNKETTVIVHKTRYRCSPLILCAPSVLLWRASQKTSCAIFRERNKERKMRAVHEDTGAHVFAEGARSGHADCVARDLFARELCLRSCRVAGKR